MGTTMSRIARIGVGLLSVVLFVRCADPTLPNSIPGNASLSKGGGKGGGGSTSGPAVTSVDPPYGYRGDTDNEITITGSGFNGDLEVAWERGGVADPKIIVHSASVLNSSTIAARISIAEDADIAVYDISVTLLGPDRKKGIGTELFEVTTAIAIGRLGTSGATNANAISDAGHIAGLSAGAFFWEPGGTMVSLGSGNAHGVDNAGRTVAGHTSLDITAAYPAVWTRSAGGGPWVRALLPSKGWNGRVFSLASDGAGNAFLIGGYIREPLNRKNSVDRPVIWRQNGGWELVELPYPSGAAASTGLRVQDVNAHGAAVGSGYLWEPAAACAPSCPGSSYSVAALPPLSPVNGISADGNIVVGGYNNSPAYIYRVGGTWHGPVILKLCSSSSGGGWAHGVNAANVIVGTGCDGAYAWRVDGGTVIETVKLPGLGPKNSTSKNAWAVSNASPARVAGDLTGGNLAGAAYWELQ